MFFHERPDTFFSYARIEVVDKPDPTGSSGLWKPEGDLSTTDLAVAMGYVKITSTLSKAIRQLIDEGHIAYLNPVRLFC